MTCSLLRTWSHGTLLFQVPQSCEAGTEVLIGKGLCRYPSVPEAPTSGQEVVVQRPLFDGHHHKLVMATQQTDGLVVEAPAVGVRPGPSSDAGVLRLSGASENTASNIGSNMATLGHDLTCLPFHLIDSKLHSKAPE